VKSSREAVGEFEHRAAAVIVTSGGIGHNHELMRRNWPTERVGAAPAHMISGVPAHVDGRMQAISEEAGATMVNKDRMWAYVEGIHNWDPVWPDHAIRILPGPSSMWFDATGRRLEGMSGVPGADSIGAMKQILATGFDYSWFVLTQSIIEKEFALSGSEQNPDITGKDLKFLLKSRLAKGAPGPVEAFKEHGEDFVVAETLDELIEGMNKLARGAQLDPSEIERQIVARDRELDNDFSKDVQLMAIANARRSRTDKLIRVAKPHRILDPEHGPLIAVRLNILSRKTLGGLETNLDSQCVAADGAVIPGLYAAGEVAGFGGGGVHGYNALEGTFLGGCIFSGRAAGRAIARGTDG
ncbi:MAG: FAD-binding dehydrogenase, partial [Nocardioides sp.]|uniref:FAD-binding dehydrogenase n=1 Tax=Nocardioides sp. TaxID=35761 RepID=UPI003264BB05